MLRPQQDHDAAAAALWSPRDPAAFAGLVHYATLAANSHNAQAWRFRETPQGVTILPDLSRALAVADPDNHHLYVSLGCAAENLMLAAGASGRSSALDFAAEGDGWVDVTLGQRAASDPLFEAILARQSTRSDYDGAAVPPGDLARLTAAAQVEGAEVLLIEDRARIEQVLELTLAANTRQVSDPAFARELVTWLRFSPGAAISTGDGLFAASSGNPTLPDAIGRVLFRFVFKPESENTRVARQIRSSSGLAVIVTQRDDPAHWVQAGRAAQRFALQATALGLRHAYLNQAVEVADTRKQLQELLGLGTRRPDLVLRYGYGPAMPRALRRPVADVIAA